MPRFDRNRRRHLDRLRAKIRDCPAENDDIGRPASSLRGWRLDDGQDHPVTVTYREPLRPIDYNGHIPGDG